MYSTVDGAVKAIIGNKVDQVGPLTGSDICGAFCALIFGAAGIAHCRQSYKKSPGKRAKHWQEDTAASLWRPAQKPMLLLARPLRSLFSGFLTHLISLTAQLQATTCQFAKAAATKARPAAAEASLIQSSLFDTAMLASLFCHLQHNRGGQENP